MYIIIWRSNHKEPHISQDDHGFKETYGSYENAKKSAEETLEAEGPKSQWYFDYEIFEEAKS